MKMFVNSCFGNNKVNYFLMLRKGADQFKSIMSVYMFYVLCKFNFNVFGQ